MRGEFQECGYECCIAMSHRRYRHHLLTTAPPPPIDDCSKGPSTNDVHKNYGFVDHFGRISANLSFLLVCKNLAKSKKEWLTDIQYAMYEIQI